jgi:DNA-binding SARP family transcriptional activator
MVGCKAGGLTMTGRLHYAILGPVRAWRDGTEIDLGSPQQRAVLGLLLLRGGWSLSLDDLINELWGEDVPLRARGTVRTYIYRLRRVLGTTTEAPGRRSGSRGPSTRPEPVLISTDSGYALPTAAGATDLDTFQDETSRARAARAQGHTTEARERLDRALALWQGPALAGIRAGYVDRRRKALEELRLAALEDLAGVDLELGRADEAMSALLSAVSTYPLRERLRELMMLALYRSGRQSDALDVYQEVRGLLQDEVGIDPGPGMRELHLRILRSDPRLDGPAPRAGPGIPASAAHPGEPQLKRPAQLPADLPGFVGRKAETAQIQRLLTRSPGPPVVGLTGLGGMGKTALAVHVARVVRGEFPDGQVYADLGAGGRPADPREVIGWFLGAFGVTGAALPETLDERAALWRTLLDGRRVLVVLDGAEDAEQIRRLLPSADGCAVLVTSWRRMLRLGGVHWMTLGALQPDEALELLGRIAGRDRVLGEAEASRRFVAACSYMPLAVQIGAARLLARPWWTVAQIEQQLRDDLRRPVVMHEDCKVVDASFQRAESRMAPDLAAAFRLAAIPDCARLSVDSTAAVLDVSRNHAQGVLESLVDAHLLENVDTGLYTFNDLAKAYARRRARSVDGEAACRSALRRLVRFYLTTAGNAVAVINDLPAPVEITALSSHTGLTFTDRRAAQAWLDTAQGDISAVLDQVDNFSEPAVRSAGPAPGAHPEAASTGR